MSRFGKFLVWVGLLALSMLGTAHAQTLTVQKAAYAPNELIAVELADFPGNAQDWITVVPSTAPPDTYGEWFYTGGKKNGSFTFKGLPAGSYEARGYFNWPGGGFSIQARAPVRVQTEKSGRKLSLVTSPVHFAGRAIDIGYEGFSGAAQDWITIVPVNTPPDQYAEWYYTSGKTRGKLRFKGLPVGSYEARGYFDWPDGAYTVKVTRAFTVVKSRTPSPPPARHP